MSSPKATERPPAAWIEGREDTLVLEPRAPGADLLIVGYLNEIPPRDIDLHFPMRRVVPVARALQRLEGWRGAHVYYTDNAMRCGTPSDWQRIEFMTSWAGGELLHVNHFNTVKEPNV